METRKDVLCFLNELVFADKLNNNDLEKLAHVKKVVVKEFAEYNISKMIYALNIINEIKPSDVTNDVDHQLERTESSRSIIFYSISFRHLAGIIKKQENKQ